MLKIYGRISSINVRKVVLAAQVLGLPFERVDTVAFSGLVRSPEYAALNPNALVPTLDDDGFVLWESNVIVRYLCARHGAGSLYPTDLRARFDAERWMDWEQTTFNGAGRDAFLQLIRVPEAKRDPALIERSVQATEPLLGILDAHLANRAWMCGDTLTMADLPLACEMHRWWNLPLAHPEHPHLRRWWNAIRALPAARGVLDLPLA
jgi:glutathione S-transferase